LFIFAVYLWLRRHDGEQIEEAEVTGERCVVCEVNPRKPDGEFTARLLNAPRDGTGQATLSETDFFDGCQELKEWVFKRVQDRVAYLAINARGAIIAHYIAGCLGDVHCPVLIYETPKRRERKEDFPSLPSVIPIEKLSGDGAVVMVDSVIKTGFSGSTIYDQLIEHDVGPHRIWYLALVACGIHADGLKLARTLSDVPRSAVSIEKLFLKETNQLVKKYGVAPDHHPHCVAFIAPGPVEPLKGLR
jgi:hypothetical protein